MTSRNCLACGCVLAVAACSLVWIVVFMHGVVQWNYTENMQGTAPTPQYRAAISDFPAAPPEDIFPWLVQLCSLPAMLVLALIVLAFWQMGSSREEGA